MDRYKHIWTNKATGKLACQESDFVESIEEAKEQYRQEYCEEIYDYQYTLILKDDGDFDTVDVEELLEEDSDARIRYENCGGDYE